MRAELLDALTNVWAGKEGTTPAVGDNFRRYKEHLLSLTDPSLEVPDGVDEVSYTCSLSLSHTHSLSLSLSLSAH